MTSRVLHLHQQLSTESDEGGPHHAYASDGRSLASMPPDAPLSMPTGSLRRWKRADKRTSLHPWQTPWLSRLFVFGAALLLTVYGAMEMYQVVSVASTTGLQWVLLALFTVNFSWIALAFTSALLGMFVLVRLRGRAQSPPVALSSKTAVVMPVYNESPARTFGALAAIRESIEATGLGAGFEYFVLSDTTNPDVWIAEERAYLALCDELGADARLYYRHRPKNTHRKAGNIGDFVSRWGGAYDHMLVLDADSLMTGACVTHLAAAMEADPDAGIIQSLPLIINRNTLFARVQQFAARIYGPVIAAGLAAWSGRDGNYWGHNAIIRTRAFADYCGLPDLSGKPPFGGHILSHDFVEAAFIRRAGWSVSMLPALEGSYEESPPSLIDLSARDRRWCQGNLQHSRVISAKGLAWPTRQHFATGIMSYLASPFWLFQLVVGIVLVLQTRYVRPEYFTQEFNLFPAWPRFDPERALALFALTMGILLAPKVFGLLIALTNRQERRSSGGGLRLIVSSFLEIILSALLAPIMMVIQSGSVFEILLGRDTGWQPQRRDDGGIAFGDIVRRHRIHMTLGLIAGISAFMIAPSLFAWMSPTILGLVLAIPISWASGRLRAGLALKRMGILTTPEEHTPPPIVARAAVFQSRLEAYRFDDREAFDALYTDASLRMHHERLLALPIPSKRGEIDPTYVLAQAKLAQATSFPEARAWLNRQEQMIVLNDRSLLARLIALPPIEAPLLSSP